jgi:hypothetical protein
MIRKGDADGASLALGQDVSDAYDMLVQRLFRAEADS